MAVLDRRIERHRAVDAARDDHGGLEREVDLGLEDAGSLAPMRLPGRGEIGVGGDTHLALAVIAELRALEDAGPPIFSTAPASAAAFATGI